MNFIFQLIVVLTFAGCATGGVQQALPPRGVASHAEYLSKSYNAYFSGADNVQKIKKIEVLTAQYYAALPDKGNAKKRLVSQFLRDVQIENKYLASGSSVLPSLGRVVASFKTLSRLGIYLSASGVFEPDTTDEEYYLSMLNRVTFEIENELKGAILIYKPENKEADENNSALIYVNNMASDIRGNLYKVLHKNNSSLYKKLDLYFMALSKVANVPAAKKLIKSPDFYYAKNTMQGLHHMNSGEIDGFQDEIDLTIATKFNFEMINELIMGLR